MTAPNFSRLQELCEQLTSDVGPAALHGAVCGYASARGVSTEVDVDDVAREFLERLGYGDVRNVAVPAAELMRSTLTELEREDFGFQLGLPGDDEPLAARTRALGEWCGGFLSAFGLAGSDRSLSAEAQEALGDFAEISKVSEDVEESDQSEADFLEISEYVRVAALTLYLESAAARPSVRSGADEGSRADGETRH